MLFVLIAESGISFVAPVTDPDMRESVHLVAMQPPPRPPTPQLMAKTPAPIEVSKQRVEGAKVAPPALAPVQGKTDLGREPDPAAGDILPAPATFLIDGVRFSQDAAVDDEP